MSKEQWFARFERMLGEFWDRFGREPTGLEEQWIADRAYKWDLEVDWDKEIGSLLNAKISDVLIPEDERDA